MDKPPDAVVDALDDADNETLQAVIEFCRDELERDSSDVNNKPERDQDPPDEFEGDAEQWANAVDDCEAPVRATLTKKTISGNQYLYYQWSENGKTRSEYIAPVNPKR